MTTCASPGRLADRPTAQRIRGSGTCALGREQGQTRYPVLHPPGVPADPGVRWYPRTPASLSYGRYLSLASMTNGKAWVAARPYYRPGRIGTSPAYAAPRRPDSLPGLVDRWPAHGIAHPSRGGAAKPRGSPSQPGCRMEL